MILWLGCSEETEHNTLTSAPKKSGEESNEPSDDTSDSDNEDNNEEASSEPTVEPEPSDDTSNPTEPSDDTRNPTTFSLYDFTLPDLNPDSSLYGNDITPSDYLGEVTGWYFIKAT